MDDLDGSQKRAEAALDRIENNRIRRMDRSGDLQENARNGLAGTVMVLSGAVLAGSVQLRAAHVVAPPSDVATALKFNVILGVLSLFSGVLFFLARFLEAEAVRRITVKGAPMFSGKLKKYDEVGWTKIGVSAHHAMPFLLGAQTSLWFLAGAVYGGVVLAVL